MFTINKSIAAAIVLFLAAQVTANPVAAPLPEPVAEAQTISTNTPVLPSSCSPPTSPSDSTYGICAYPTTQQAALDTAPMTAYLQGRGCRTIQGGGVTPNTGMTGLGCAAGGPDNINNAVAGWAVNSSFNPKACPPGSKCA